MHRAEAHETARLSMGMVLSPLACESSCRCLVRKLCRGRGPCTLASSPTSTTSAYPAACEASISQHSAMQIEKADCRTRVVEARLPRTASSLLPSRQAQLGNVFDMKHEEAPPLPHVSKHAKANLHARKGGQPGSHSTSRADQKQRREESRQAGMRCSPSAWTCQQP